MNFETYYTESILDMTHKGLDPTVFQLNAGVAPILQPSIKEQIFKDIMEFKRSLQVNKAYIIGSILTRNYNRRSDIDVTLEFNEEDIDEDTGVMGVERIISALRSLNGKLATGTTHPINYYVTTNFIEDNADAVYDLETDKWIKEPLDTEVAVSEYLQKFNDLVSSVDLTTGKLKRDVIDYDELKNMDDYTVVNMHTLLSKKMYEINKNIDSLVKFKKQLKAKRDSAFNRPMSPEEITKYSSKNKLPINVIYKLFQRYYYFDLIQQLDDIISNRDNEHEYVGEIEDLLVNGESISFSDYLVIDEKIRSLRGGNINWKQPKAVRKYKDKRFQFNKSIQGNNLNQIPDYQRSHRSLGLSQKLVNIAKKAPSGIWRLTPMQVKELAIKYHHISPNEKNPVKHLGNTGIVVWRKERNKYFLVKHRRAIR